MWKRLAMVGMVAFLALAAPAAAQDIQPPEDATDPSGCNEYHRMRESLDAMTGGELDEFQTGEGELVVVDPIFDLIAMSVLWATDAFPCK